MKFCKDCKHFFSGKCESPHAEELRDPVSGEWPDAATMRCYITRFCTKTADWFEPTYKKARHD